jgi:type IV secretory pathway TraG/TraD family ATPase VirD4
MPIKTTHELMGIAFRWMAAGFEYTVKGWALNKKTGARFAKAKDYKSYLSPRNKGLLLDGKSLRLSEKVSYQNVAVYGVTGKGKSTAFVRPIILDKANSSNVLIVNDMSGDLYQDTSGYMASKGYRVIVLNPHDLEHSHRFNPFLELQNENETLHLAQMFVQAVSSQGEPMWAAGAERFVTFFLKCLRKKGEPYNNPHNLYYLFQSFGEDGSNLHRFVAECSYDDPFMVNEWKSLISVHREGILSFIMNATTALKIFANKDVCALTSQSDIDLSDIRKQKTIIYVITPPQYAKVYRSVTSMFFLSFLQACMKEMPSKKDLPVYFLYDEFGNSFLPDFDVYATTVRKYRISLMLFMQGINQLNKNYGRETASVIMSGIATQISFGAAEQETAEYFEKRAGKVRLEQYPNLKDPQMESHSDHHLITYSEIRELPDDTLLVISDNRRTTLLQSTPSYKNAKFARQMRKAPVNIQSKADDHIVFLPLQE